MAGIEYFTKFEFEEALRDTGYGFLYTGFSDGEHTYAVPVKSGRFTVNVVVRSSLRMNGVSADLGRDSIRCYLADENGKPMGSKVGRWVTRQPGWQGRMKDVLQKLVDMGGKIGACPTCGKPKKVFVTKNGPNVGRAFSKCPEHDHFQWLDNSATTPLAPDCPKCSAIMVTRKRRSDGRQFWGCSQYPSCNGTRPYDQTRSAVAQEQWDDEGSDDKASQSQLAAAWKMSRLAKSDPIPEVVQNALNIAAGKVEADSPRSDEFVPSTYQSAIFDFVSSGCGNAVVEAVAGSGKTTTIVRALEYTKPTDKIAFVAFNVHIVRELSQRAPKHVKVSTCHSLGFSAIRAAYPSITPQRGVDSNKIRRILEETMDRHAWGHLFSSIQRLVSLVKANLLDPTDENLLELADHYGVELNGDHARIFEATRVAVARSLQMADTVIDFDDMNWVPVVADLPCEEYDFLFLDEAQDFNVCQTQFVLRSVRAGGRVVAVGDRNQSLYGFRGADTEAIPNLIEALNAKTLPLSITYRNPKSVVALVNEKFPNIPFEAWDQSDEGAVRTVMSYLFIAEAKPGDMVVCRTNAPLVKPVFALIRMGIKATIRGRDIGKGLIDLIKKMKTDDIRQLLRKLAEYEDSETVKLTAARRMSQVQALQDKVETLVALADGVSTVVELISRIESVFSDEQEGVIFSSIHRAKGLEADRVFILRPDLLPHPMATQEWEHVQEANCGYVAITRAKRELVYVE